MNIFSNTQFCGAFILMVVCVATGYIMRRKGIITDDGRKMLTALIYKLCVPCIAYVAFMKDLNPQEFRTGAMVLAAAFVFYIVFCCAGTALFRKSGRDTALTAGFMCAVGQLTLFTQPLLRASGSEMAVLYCGIMTLAFRFMVYGAGAALLGGRSSAKKIFLNPIMLSMLAGLFVWLSQDALPYVGYLRIDRTLPALYSAAGTLADMVCPLGMLLIGANIGSDRLSATFRDRKAWLAAFIRSAACPVIVSLISRCFFDTDAVMALTLGFAAPSSVTLSAFCTASGHDEEFSGHIVVLSTLICLIVIPLL